MDYTEADVCAARSDQSRESPSNPSGEVSLGWRDAALMEEQDTGLN